MLFQNLLERLPGTSAGLWWGRALARSDGKMASPLDLCFECEAATQEQPLLRSSNFG